MSSAFITLVSGVVAGGAVEKAVGKFFFLSEKFSSKNAFWEIYGQN